MNPGYYKHMPEVQEMIYRYAARRSDKHYDMNGTAHQGRAPEWNRMQHNMDINHQDYYWTRLWEEAAHRIDYLVMRVIRDEYAGWPGYDILWVVPDFGGSASMVSQWPYRYYYKVAMPCKRRFTKAIDLAWWERIVNREVVAGFVLARDEYAEHWHDPARVVEEAYSEELDYEKTWRIWNVEFPTYPFITTMHKQTRADAFREAGYRGGLEWPEPLAEELKHYASWA